jgi:hypothetical protein
LAPRLKTNAISANLIGHSPDHTTLQKVKRDQGGGDKGAGDRDHPPPIGPSIAATKGGRREQELQGKF